VTESERQFEQFCSKVGWRYTPIQTGVAKTPDYKLFVGELCLIIEVKEIKRPLYDSPNPEYQDQYVTVRLRTKTVGDQVRAKIKKAAPQLRRLSTGKYPTIVVIYDLHDPGLRLNSEPRDFLSAMYGQRQVVLSVPKSSTDVRIVGSKFGPGRKTTRTDNTSISAVASLWLAPDGALSLDLYHNVFAELPIKPEFLSNPRVKQFTIDQTDNAFQMWRPIGGSSC